MGMYVLLLLADNSLTGHNVEKYVWGLLMVKIVLDYLRVVTDDITLCLEVDLFAVLSTGAQ